MKTLATAVVLSMSLMAGAQAADLSQEPTRAQVQAELAQAKAQGQYTFGEEAYPAALPQTQALSSQDVAQQLAQAKAEGEVTFGNLDYPPQAAVSGPSETRAQVKADLAQAKADGTVTFGNLDYPPQAS
ncbi:DUF4148 domain-containing protein [Bordetella genomosp. 5]|uniref:DUF4148 domain-containing protein n=1 Tax=Bordetella genomosp. 5 TaxID=1395608 RepID=A0A261TYY5_9BORD|nr:DUF4148 domain-containing protein [Bordetella genomosp. 5]OZI54894.1 hypothetical protein CAL25_00270 [Bordetella genomosp. 5]